MHINLNDKGVASDELLNQMDDLAANDADWRKGRTFGLVFYPGKEVSI